MRAGMPVMKFAVCCLALAVCLAASRANAQITAVSQSRTDYASVAGIVNAHSAPGFGLFTNIAAVSAFRNGYLSSAMATQNSQIGSSVITASAKSTTTAGGGTAATAESVFDVTFDLTTTCSYTLSGSTMWVNNDSTDQGYSFVQLSQSGAAIFQAGPYATPIDSAPFSTSGVLGAGEYRIWADSSSAGPVGTSSGFNLTLSVTPVPEPATGALVGTSVLILLARVRKRQANR
jgi:hypothetical protein